MNRPQRDESLIKEAGIPLDRALFPLLVGIERFGPIGVVELADRVGRDYTTVSRQVAKLESLGLVERRGSAADRRVREAVITPKGKAMTDLVDAARERIGRAIFETWDAARHRRTRATHAEVCRRREGRTAEWRMIADSRFQTFEAETSSAWVVRIMRARVALRVRRRARPQSPQSQGALAGTKR